MRELFGKYAKRTAIGLSLTAAMMSAALPTYAGKDFFKKDCRSQTTKVCQIAGAKLSADKLTFVVHGGNRNLQMAAYRAAQRLDDEGVPVAFLLAPDEDNIDITMSVEFYAKGGYKYAVMAYDNDKNTPSENEQGIYNQAKKAYQDDFGKLASVTAGQDSTVKKSPASNTLAAR